MKSPGKIKQLASIFKQELGGNKARLFLLSHLVLSLLKVRNVNFKSLATGYYNGAKLASRLRRVQRFFSEFRFEQSSYCKLIIRMLPVQGSYKLSLDRTNWKLGCLNINLLFLSVIYQGVGLPILWCVLGDKRGNSSQQERIDLLNRFITFIGRDKIEYLTADREFIGQDWLSFLEHQQIRFFIRVRKNMHFTLSSGKIVKAHWLLHAQPLNQPYFYPKIVRLNGVLLYFSGLKYVGQDGKIEYLILISYTQEVLSLAIYKERWQIEMMFKAFKSAGFNLENTHIQDPERLDTLLGLMAIAFIWAYNIGVHLHQQVKPIPIKTHGRRAMSIFVYGLDHLTEILINALDRRLKNAIALFLSCT